MAGGRVVAEGSPSELIGARTGAEAADVQGVPARRATLQDVFVLLTGE